MPRLKGTSPSTSPRSTARATAAPRGALERLAATEYSAVLRALLAAHPELRGEAEAIARNLMAAPSVDAIADQVRFALNQVPVEAVYQGAGERDGQYSDPGEVAWELLAEALEADLAAMKRRMAIGLVDAAEATCKGLIQGLHQAATQPTSETLGWADDFPKEYAGHVVTAWLRSWPMGERAEAWERLGAWLGELEPDWLPSVTRDAARAIARK